MMSWYLAVYKGSSRILDAVALNERGMESALKDFRIMLEHGADRVIIQEFNGDTMISEKEYLK